MNSSLAAVLLSEGTDHFQLYHGGTMQKASVPKSGKWEYGPGLYLTTAYDVAKGYAGGRRRVWLCKVAKGNEINACSLPAQSVKDFLKLYGGSQKKEILLRLDRYAKDGHYPASVLMNLFVNGNIRSSSAQALQRFLVENGVDYAVNRWSGGRGHSWILTLFNDSLLLGFTPVSYPGAEGLDLPKPE